jgi:hypothetical protein
MTAIGDVHLIICGVFNGLKIAQGSVARSLPVTGTTFRRFHGSLVGVRGWCRVVAAGQKLCLVQRRARLDQDLYAAPPWSIRIHRLFKGGDALF